MDISPRHQDVIVNQNDYKQQNWEWPEKFLEAPPAHPPPAIKDPGAKLTSSCASGDLKKPQPAPKPAAEPKLDFEWPGLT